MFGKKLAASLLSLCLVASMCPAVGIAYADNLQAANVLEKSMSAVSTQAAKNLKNSGVKFDLKKGKSVKTKKYLKGVGKQGYTVKLSSLKITNAKKSGYKKATLTVSFNLKKRLTKKQSKAVFKAWKSAYSKDGNAASVVWAYKINAGNYFFVADYETGKNLENPNNDAGVTVSSKWSYSGLKKYKSGDFWFNDAKKTTAKVTIQFPSDYENLCFGVGGGLITRSNQSKADASFLGESYYKGNRYLSYNDYYKSTYYKTSFFKNKSNYHFIRIS